MIKANKSDNIQGIEWYNIINHKAKSTQQHQRTKRKQSATTTKRQRKRENETILWIFVKLFDIIVYIFCIDTRHSYTERLIRLIISNKLYINTTEISELFLNEISLNSSLNFWLIFGTSYEISIYM